MLQVVRLWGLLLNHCSGSKQTLKSKHVMLSAAVTYCYVVLNVVHPLRVKCKRLFGGLPKLMLGIACLWDVCRVGCLHANNLQLQCFNSGNKSSPVLPQQDRDMPRQFQSASLAILEPQNSRCCPAGALVPSQPHKLASNELRASK